MKFTIIASHPNLCTGYAKIGTQIANELIKKHDVYYLGFQNTQPDSINREINEKIKVYDLYDLDKESLQGFGDNAIVPCLKEIEPDIIIIYNDHSVCSSVLKIIKDVECKKWCYLDLVYEYQYFDNINFISKTCDKILAFSDSWKKHLEDFYEIPKEKLITLHHGIKKIESSLTRKDLGLKEDDFVILSLNRNDSRKNIDLVLNPFLNYYKLCKNRDKLYLFINCRLNTGIDIINVLKIFCKILELDFPTVQKHIITPRVVGRVTDDYIHGLYRITDAGISITSGEGFGLTVIEQLQYDKPVICSRLPIFEEILGKDYPFFVDPVTSGFSYDNLGGIKKYFRLQDCVEMLQRVCFMDYSINYSNKLTNKYKWEKLIPELLEKINA